MEPAPLADPAPPPPARPSLPRRWFVGLFAALVMSQAFLAFMGAGDDFVLGHNGWNSSAYLQSARNTLRWGTLFPVQYYTGRTPPTVRDGYTHHPLGMHLHNTAAVALFGDHPGTIRGVPALFAVLALIALILVVRLLYDERIALVAGAVYVLLPTNAIYLNMSNHESGFIFWTCLWALFYLRFIARRLPLPSAAPAAAPSSPARRAWLVPYALMLFCFFWAAMWDWPAYYCALVLAMHWFFVILRHHRGAPNRLRAMLPDLALLGGYCFFVLALFVGHFLLVAAVVGSISELHGVFEARQVAGRAMMLNHIKVVPILMFTLPVLLVAFGWFFHRLWQSVRGRLVRRDLLALTFGVAGLLHYYIFRGTAVIHEYWGWTLVPFCAIAVAHVLVTLIDRARPWLAERWPRHRRLALGLAVVVPTLLITGNLAWRFVDLVPRGRAVGGSLWFVEHTRPVLESYISSREMIRFAKEVKALTTRRTGVMIDPALPRMRGYEPRFPITLDREVLVQSLKTPPPERLGVSDGWVYVAPRSTLYQRRLVQLALSHPVLVYDDFVMVDLRRHETEVRVFASQPVDRSLWHWYWRGPWAEAVEPVRQPDEETRLLEAIAEFRAANPR